MGVNAAPLLKPGPSVGGWAQGFLPSHLGYLCSAGGVFPGGGRRRLVLSVQYGGSLRSMVVLSGEESGLLWGLSSRCEGAFVLQCHRRRRLATSEGVT